MYEPKRSVVTGVLVAIGLALPAAAQLASPTPAPLAAPSAPAEVAPPAPAKDPSVELADLVARIAGKFASAKQYVFDGYIDVSPKSGEGPMFSLAKAKVKFAV